MKSSKDEEQVIFNNLLKMIHCLSYDVYNNDINMDFLSKVENIRQYRQSVINSGTKNFFSSDSTENSEIKDNDNGCSI